MDFTADGYLLLSLTGQGRYVEIGPDGELLSEFVNIRDDTHIYWTKHAQIYIGITVPKVRELNVPTNSVVGYLGCHFSQVRRRKPI